MSRIVRTLTDVKDVEQLSTYAASPNDIVSDVDGNIYIRTNNDYMKINNENNQLNNDMKSLKSENTKLKNRVENLEKNYSEILTQLSKYES